MASALARLCGHKHRMHCQKGTVVAFFIFLNLVDDGSASLLSCPSRCLCHPVTSEGGAENGYRTNCRGLWLRTVPTGISSNTTELDLGQNYLTSIRTEFVELVNLEILRLDANYIQEVSSGAFRTQRRLKELYLQNNWICKLNFGVFHGLGSLEKLQLYNGGVEQVEAGVFDELTSIKTIELSYNRIVALPQGAFRNLLILQSLVITNNELVSIGDEAFCNLPSLSYLNLRNNLVTTVPERAVCGLTSLSTFILLDNPLVCDCDAKWLYEFLLDNRLSGPVCGSPQELRGRNLLDLEQGEFCDFPTALVISNSSSVLERDESVQLICNTTGHPMPIICWNKDEERIDDDTPGVTISDNGLTISSLRLRDSGVYQCIASSGAGATSDSITISVIDLEQETLLSTLIHTTGSNIQIPCSMFSEIDRSLVTWTFNSLPINVSDSSKHFVLEGGDLLVTSTELADSGKYVCVIGDIEINRTVTIQEPPNIIEFPELLCKNSSLVVYTSAPARLVCSAVGNPLPTVQWFLDSVPLITEGGGLQETFTATRVHEIPSPSSLDEGKYTCLAQNSVGEDLREVTVEVRVFTEQNTTIQLSDARAGDVLSLPCSFTAPGTVTWERVDGQALPTRSVTAIDGSLFLSSLSLSDGGEYLCNVQTNVGDSTLHYNVTVLAPPTFPQVCVPPLFQVFENENLTLFCNVTAYPLATIRWFKNEEEIDSVLEPGTFKIIDDSSSLVISAAKRQHVGRYRCEAENVLGNVSLFFDVDTLRLPTLITSPNDTVVNASETALFRCSGEGNPQPDVAWWRVRNGILQALETDGRIIVGEEYLTIVSAVPDDSGQYFCVINSSLGMERSTNVFLNVWTRPVLLGSLPSDYTIAKGTPVLLLCIVEGGDPVPAVRWYKDGVLLPTDNQDRFGLTILNPTAEDEGEYLCRAVNVAGEVTLKVLLTVQIFPSVTVTPSTTVLFVGCTALLTCLNHNSPPQNFTWSFRGMQLRNTSQLTIRNSGDLIVWRLQLEDSGNYTCTVQSELGTVNSSAVVIVLDPSDNGSGEQPPVRLEEPPTILTITPRALNVNLGSFVQLVCTAQGVPSPAVSWTKEGSQLIETSQLQIQNGHLLIMSVVSSDSGVYQCTAINRLGSVRENFVVNVNTVPSFENQLRNMELLVGDSVIIDCVITGQPPPTVHWIMNGIDLVSGGRLIVLDNNTLVITNSTFSDSGLYTCIGSNVAGTAQSSFQLTVTVPKEHPVFTFLPPSQVIRSSPANVTLSCQASGMPPPVITWSRQHQDIEEIADPRYIILSNGSLVILNSMIQDSGMYECSAANEAGIASFFIDIQIISDTSPLFRESPQDQFALTRSSLALPCSAEGDPKPLVFWMQEGNALLREQGLTISENGTLLISEVGLHHAGHYTCYATDGQTTISASAKIRVEERKEPPYFTKKPLDMDLMKGENLILHCESAGPGSIRQTWLYDRKPIANEDLRVLVIEEGTKLLIASVDTQDTGSYTCQSDNVYGQSEWTAFVQVHLYPSNNSLSYTTQSITQIMCTDNDLSLGISWSKDGALIDNSASVNVFVLAGNLWIFDMLLENAGDYTCHTEGQQLKVFHVKVVAPPSIKIDNSSLRRSSGQDVSLNCESTGIPNPTVFWKRGSETLILSNKHSLYANGTLIIHSLSFADGGNYTCYSVNTIGHAKGTYHLLVE